MEKKYASELSVEEALSLRRLLDRQVSSTFSKAASELTTTKRTAQRVFSDALRNQLRQIPELTTPLGQEHMYFKLFDSQQKSCSAPLLFFCNDDCNFCL